MLQRSVVKVAAWLEIIVGTSIVTVPDLLCMLLFGTKPEGVGVTLARFAGVGLIALGIACLPSTGTKSRQGVVGLFVFNAGVTVLLAWVAVTTVHGIMLWPVVILHAAIAIALAQQLFTTKGGIAEGV